MAVELVRSPQLFAGAPYAYAAVAPVGAGLMTTGSEVDAARREDARQLLANVTLPTIGEHTYETVAQSTFGPRLFGGHVVAIVVAAVMRDAGSAQAPNSLHAYFLRPV